MKKLIIIFGLSILPFLSIGKSNEKLDSAAISTPVPARCAYIIVYRKYDYKVTKPFQVSLSCELKGYLKYAWSGFVWRSYGSLADAMDDYNDLVAQRFTTVSQIQVGAECSCR